MGAVRLAASFLLLIAALGSAADPSDGARRLYLEGVTPSGEPLRALVGIGNAPIAGQAVACGNCHGADGRGRAEGAVVPSDINWEELTKPYGHAHPHRRHRAFTEASFARAVNEGLDPDGNRLDWAMPRYALSRSELEALVAHLKRLGAEHDPGIGEASVRIGTILPRDGTVRAVLEAYVEKLNAAGGIHRRRLELAPHDAAGPVFALLSLDETLKAPGVPAVAGFSQGGSAFSVFPGPAEQAALLVEFAAQRARVLQPAILAPEDRAQLAVAAAAQCAKRGCADSLRIGWRVGELDAAAVARDLKQARRAQIFFFGAEAELAQVLGAVAEARDPGWRPSIYAPGALARAAAPAREHFAGELFLSVPASARAAALSAAAVLAEGLRRAGRDLSRERFVRALESLNNYDPEGHGPPVSFGPGRRTGARGGYVAVLERSRGVVPASGWISLD